MLIPEQALSVNVLCRLSGWKKTCLCDCVTELAASQAWIWSWVLKEVDAGTREVHVSSCIVVSTFCFLDDLDKISEIACCCSILDRLCTCIPSVLWWPILSMMSCSSTPAWKRQVAAVTQREWLILKPPMPAAVQILDTVSCSVWWPIARGAYQQFSVGFVRGLK